MTRVRCARPIISVADLKIIGSHKTHEFIPTDAKFASIFSVIHIPKLNKTDPGSLLTNLFHELKGSFLSHLLQKLMF